MQVERRRNPFRRWLTYLPLPFFVLICAAVFWNEQGDDLASSYVGCRVLASGHPSSLYSYDPSNFAGVSEVDRIWPQQAIQGAYLGWLHPYVQTPLWALTLKPLCSRMQWPGFKHLFLVLALLSIAGCVYLVAYHWTPRFLNPLAITLILVALVFSEPFLFAMELIQTHALLLFLTVAGLVLAERERPVAAGICVAIAAAVKITPGIVLLYWLMSRRWRAASSLLASSALLLLATRLTAGASLFHDYLMNMHRVSHVLLVAENNQSLASWYMGSHFSSDEVFDVNAFPLPATVSVISAACMVCTTALGGVLDRSRHGANSPDFQAPPTRNPPLGIAMTLIALTTFAPIAWTHYYIVLVIPVMMLAQSIWNNPAPFRRWVLVALSLVVAALQYRPLAPDVIRMDLGDIAVLRGTFYSAILCLVALWIAYPQALHPQKDPASSMV